MTSRLREGFLWAGAVAGLFSLVTAVAVTFFGFSFLIFRSGSMNPDIPTGSLALARTVPAAEIRSGDVLSVIASNGERVTHRVVTSTLRVTDDGQMASLVMQGDANGTPDDEIYQVTEAEREIASLPHVGYAVTVLLSPPGVVAAGCLAAMLLLLGFGSNPTGPSGPRREAGRHRGGSLSRSSRSRASASVGLSMVAVVIVGAGVTSTSAFFTDQAGLKSGEFSSRSLTAPTLTCSSGATATVTFPTVSFPTAVTYNATLDNGVNLTVSGSGANRSISISQNQAPPGGNFLSGGSTNYTVTVSVTIGGWSAVSTTGLRSTRASLLFGGSNTITCP